MFDPLFDFYMFLASSFGKQLYSSFYFSIKEFRWSFPLPLEDLESDTRPHRVALLASLSYVFVENRDAL